MTELQIVDIATWLTLVVVVAFGIVLLRNQYKGFNHLNRLHQDLLRIQIELQKPQPRYMLPSPPPSAEL